MTKFPVNFPISREVDHETGSTMTGSSANKSDPLGTFFSALSKMRDNSES